MNKQWRTEYDADFGHVFSGAYEEWLEARMQEKTALIQRLDADIEALEKDLLYLAGEVAEGSDMITEAAVIWARYKPTALAKSGPPK